jgi:predicted nucleotidyltransferase
MTSMPKRGDIDVLVDFSDKVPDLFGDHVGLRKDLAGILRHAAHVITLHDVMNPLPLKSLRRDAVPDASAGACC